MGRAYERGDDMNRFRSLAPYAALAEVASGFAAASA
jgi:hypothetical protein